jgi:hypothetical protein
MVRRSTADAFASIVRKRKNGRRAEPEAEPEPADVRRARVADARPVQAADPLVVSIAAVDGPPPEHQLQRPTVAVSVIAVIVIAATAEVDAKVADATLATTGVAAAIADVGAAARELAPEPKPVVDVVAEDEEHVEAAARATTDRPTTTSTTSTIESMPSRPRAGSETADDRLDARSPAARRLASWSRR